MKKLLYSFIFFFLSISNTTSAQLTTCLDLSNLDFGACLAILGYGNINGNCAAISGCSTEVDGVNYQPFMFDTAEECEINCNNTCLDLIYLDFGPCEALLGYGMLSGECVAISGCSPIINGFDFSPYLFSTPTSCDINCGPVCMDLYTIDFGPCDMFMGYAYINGEIIALSGCGSLVDGIDYASFIYESEEICAAQCSSSCIDLANLDFGDCTTPLGITIINGECTMISGCSYEVNGVDYEYAFFDSMDDCQLCYTPTTNCVVEEIIDSTFACYYNFAPVCGCDGVTYQNDCFARLYGGVLSWTEGPCIVGIAENEIPNLEIYPNPASDILTFENPEQELFSISLFDMTGKLVTFFRINSSKPVDVSYIKQGIYLLHIVDDRNNKTIKKLVIN